MLIGVADNEGLLRDCILQIVHYIGREPAEGLELLMLGKLQSRNLLRDLPGDLLCGGFKHIVILKVEPFVVQRRRQRDKPH